MQIITLISDTGSQDYYIASIKGALLKINPDFKIIDISHSIDAFDVANTAFQLRCCYKSFPDGTIHLIGVDSEPLIVPPAYSDERKFVPSYPTIMKFHNQYFISNDNGFFGAFLDENKPQELWRYNINSDNLEEIKFPLKNCFVKIAEKIHNGIGLDSFADSVNSYKKAFIPKALIEEYIIRGVVIHVDSFGNLITNITREDFERYPADAPFTIRFHNNYFIDKISDTYNQVEEGDKVAVFNENNFLEIAVNRGATKTTGGADKLLGMRVRDLIKIEFNPKGSLKTLF